MWSVGYIRSWGIQFSEVILPHFVVAKQIGSPMCSLPNALIFNVTTWINVNGNSPWEDLISCHILLFGGEIYRNIWLILSGRIFIRGRAFSKFVERRTEGSRCLILKKLVFSGPKLK